MLADAANKKYIRILDGESYAGNFTLSGITVSIIGIANTRITAIEDNQPAVDITSNADVALEGVSITSTGLNADGIRCAATSKIRLERSIVNGTKGIGVNVGGGCELAIERSVISGNLGGGIKLVDAPFTIANNYILNNGGASSVFGGVQIVNSVMATPQVFAFNTLLDNNAATTADSRGVHCVLPGAAPLAATGNILRGGSGGVAMLKRGRPCRG